MNASRTFTSRPPRLPVNFKRDSPQQNRNYFVRRVRPVFGVLKRFVCVFQASESKREQFRRYLEKSGVLDTLTSGGFTCVVEMTPFHWYATLSFFKNFFLVLVALYEETDKPNNALEYPVHLHSTLTGTRQ